MISVSEAGEMLQNLVGPVSAETVPLREAAGRVLAHPVEATRDQPPFAASAMDGYAVNSAEAERHARFRVIGEAAAGHRFEGRVGAGEAVRIFTGAPVPEGADFVVIQEDITRDGDLITISDDPGQSTNIRPLGDDFTAGTRLAAPRLLGPPDIALLAAMNVPRVRVRRKPDVALISTGDELVMPGDTPGPDQIIASNTFGLHAMLARNGAAPRLLPIARDTLGALQAAFDLAAGADLIVTIGGASVGDHDLVGEATARMGMERAFYKVAMRPGKPLMAGKMAGTAMVGLPGNPVSAMVCGYVFILPMIRLMLGLTTPNPALQRAVITGDLPANGPRQHYMRAVVNDGAIAALPRQDSALLSVLAKANALLVRPPGDPALSKGDEVAYLPL